MLHHIYHQPVSYLETVNVPCMVFLLNHDHIVVQRRLWNMQDTVQHQSVRTGDRVTLQHCGTGIHLKSQQAGHSAPIRHYDRATQHQANPVWVDVNVGTNTHFEFFSSSDKEWTPIIIYNFFFMCISYVRSCCKWAVIILLRAVL